MIALIFVFGISIGAFGSILMKIGTSQMGPVEIHSLDQLLGFLLKLLTNFTAMAGMFLYFLAGVTWAYLLTKLDVSYVQPILALTYVATPILAIVLLHENVPLLRWVGILVIIAGVFIVARTSV